MSGLRPSRSPTSAIRWPAPRRRRWSVPRAVCSVWSRGTSPPSCPPCRRWRTAPFPTCSMSIATCTMWKLVMGCRRLSSKGQAWPLALRSGPFSTRARERSSVLRLRVRSKDSPSTRTPGLAPLTATPTRTPTPASSSPSGGTWPRTSLHRAVPTRFCPVRLTGCSTSWLTRWPTSGRGSVPLAAQPVWAVCSGIGTRVRPSPPRTWTTPTGYCHPSTVPWLTSLGRPRATSCASTRRSPTCPTCSGMRIPRTRCCRSSESWPTPRTCCKPIGCRPLR